MTQLYRHVLYRIIMDIKIKPVMWLKYKIFQSYGIIYNIIYLTTHMINDHCIIVRYVKVVLSLLFTLI